MTGRWRAPEAPLPAAREGDPRVGQLIVRRRGPDGPPASDSPEAGTEPPRAVVLGFPSDEGVRRNGGRPGASEAPNRIREELYGLTPDGSGDGDQGFHELLRATEDLGDLKVSGDVARDQEVLGQVVSRYLRQGSFVLILGGGHETAFGHFLGYVEVDRRVRILNVDAHPDVRPWEAGRPHSGSPFRQALLHPSGCCRGYGVAGLGRHCTARAHRRFLAAHGAGWLWREEVDGAALAELFDGLGRAPAMVSLDLDAVDRAYAPGVSAPATGGLEPATWLEAARLAGASPAVSSVDVVELNPRFDRDDATASLAALTVWHVLRGLASR